MEPLPGRFRSLFPIVEKYVYLNHASVAPLSRATRDCMARVVDAAMNEGPRVADEIDEMLATGRCRAARLVNAKPHQIAFLRNTSEALSAIANGIDWRRGDNVVTAAVEFPANVYPWRRIAEERGVELRAARDHGCGMVDHEELLSLVDGRTRVVTVSWVQFATGQRLDLRRIGSFCRERDVLFVVDAIQGLGGLQLNAERDCVDAFAAGAHKFLLGPKGVSLLYLSDRALEQIRPTVIGWTAVKDHSDYLAHDFDFREGALRFEGGTANVAGICGLSEAIDLMLQAGPAAVEAHLLALSASLAAGLEARGYRVVSSRNAAEMSAIVTCRHQRHSAAEICRHLDSRNIVTSARHEGLRIAPHFYNSEADLEFLLEELPQ
ncbi:MAG TPA: aminotransferase class V-fold PLP-dependent enzyme [Acidobacteriaceae bacterium]|nr:aminotransferase class V-fold PLP-dependent enzyme [Acidobacteriaceae bacterium]